MSTEIHREPFLRSLAQARPAIAGQAYIAALTHFAFDGHLVTAYNDVSAISIRTPFDLECCLPADLLVKSLNSMSAEKVLADFGEADSVVLSSGRSKVKIPYLTIDSFPTPAQTTKPNGSFKVTAGLLKGLEKCLVGVGTAPTHPAQMGITVEPDFEGAVLYATDNFTISRYQTKDQIKLPGDSPIILPTFFCNQLVTLAKAFPDEPVTVELHTGAVKALFGGQAVLFTKLLVETEPMDFGHIIARYLEGEELGDLLVDIPDGFEAAFNRALLVLEEQMDKSTKISIKDGRLKLFSASGRGEATDNLSIKAKDLEPFHADPALVSRASKLCSKMAFLPRVLVMAEGPFSHLIAHCSV